MQQAADIDLFKEDPESGCWLFLGCKGQNGYGQIKRNKKHIRAHRYFYEKYVEDIAPGMVLDHKCRTPECVKPSHLQQVTNRQNTILGRSAKLTQSDALKIRELLSEGYSQLEAGKIFNIGQPHVSDIKNNKVWLG